MASAELKGTVVHIGATQKVSDSFRKRELVIEVDGETQYPQEILIEAAQDKCDDSNLNEVRKGDTVTVGYNLRGRSWLDPKTNTNKWFNTLSLWKININQTVATPDINKAAQEQAKSTTPPPSLEDEFNVNPGEEDDLPF